MLNSNGKLINPEVRIETTNKCQANCIMCAHSEMTRPKGTMSNEIFEKIVKQAVKLGITTVSPFGFGEPLMDKKLVDKIKICANLNLETFITTNGALCDWVKMRDLFRAGLTHIRFSIHGTEQSYKKIHVGLNYSTFMTNIFSAILLRDKFYSDCKVSVTMMPINNNYVDDLLVWESVDIQAEVWRPHNWAVKKRFRKKTGERKKSCSRPTRGPIQVQWDGTVIPCCFLTDAEIVLGNIHEQTLEEILNGKAYTKLRKKHQIGDLSGLPCENCDQLNIELQSPLLYSDRDPERKINVTSSLKFSMEDHCNNRTIIGQ